MDRNILSRFDISCQQKYSENQLTFGWIHFKKLYKHFRFLCLFIDSMSWFCFVSYSTLSAKSNPNNEPKFKWVPLDFDSNLICLPLKRNIETSPVLNIFSNAPKVKWQSWYFSDLNNSSIHLIFAKFWLCDTMHIFFKYRHGEHGKITIKVITFWCWSSFILHYIFALLWSKTHFHHTIYYVEYWDINWHTCEIRDSIKTKQREAAFLPWWCYYFEAPLQQEAQSKLFSCFLLSSSIHRSFR